MTTADMPGSRALVTGGTGGVGLSIARQLAARGAAVAVTGRNDERGRNAVAEIARQGGEAHFISADSRDPDQASAAVRRAVEHMGGLDIMVSSGAEGAVPPTPFSELTPQQIREDFDTRVMARILPVHAAVSAMRSSGGGSIVMITTDAARHPTPGESVIGAAGAAILLMTKALARELGRHRIRVNGVALTLTADTPGWDRIFAKESFQKNLFSKALKRFPAGRAPSAEEVASVAVFLASPAASQVSGQTVSVNGGLSFGGW